MIRRHFCVATNAAIMAVTLLAATAAWPATESLLHTFAGGSGGASPHGALIFDSAGNLYGTSQLGGTINSNCPSGCGTVFQLIPGSNGQWTETVLHVFLGGAGGGQSLGGLIFDGNGNLYGTTSSGGTSTNCTGGCGTVFELTPTANGRWTWQALYSFTGTGGAVPVGRLALDSAGNLYGVTEFGGNSANCTGGCGTVFELIHNSTGTWTWKGVHTFSGTKFGAHPMAGLVLDSTGNLYGTSFSGGLGCNGAGCGTVFELTPPGTSGQWSLKQLHAFSGAGGDSDSPQAELVFDQAGNLYGTSTGAQEACGPCGAAFELSPTTKGPWAELVLHPFLGTLDGGAPQSALIFDTAGNIYGTTSVGGSLGGGTIFELSPNPNGKRPLLKILHSFKQAAPNPGGSDPNGLVLDGLGNLYGSTLSGAVANDGVAFELTP